MSNTLFHLLNFALLVSFVISHGLLIRPPQRGILNPSNPFNKLTAHWPDAPNDYKPHFPAGDKHAEPGSAHHSQIIASNYHWTPFEPLKPNFRWRSGVCGDQLHKPQHHMRGGIFYYNAQITATYKQASVLFTQLNIIAHHNGFMQLHICDVAKCDGEISEACFRSGHCYPLPRTPDRRCQLGYEQDCAPIDRNFPLRWYLPCSRSAENTRQIMGGHFMRWRLPSHLVCDHCVLHWFWSAANTCNPPGVLDYFDGPDRPRSWGDCGGQGNARGGVSRVQRPCGAEWSPEEYYQCADVRIVTGEVDEVDEVEVDEVDEVDEEDGELVARGMLLRYIQVIGDGEIVAVLEEESVVDITAYKQVTLEVVSTKELSSLHFQIDGQWVWRDWTRPYFLFGNVGRTANYWNDVITNRMFDVRVRAEEEGEQLTVRLKLVKM